MTRVKICGLRRVDDALTAVDAGADFLGFVFAPSRRRIRPEEAREIIAAVRERSDARMVGVFVNETPAVMNRIARLVGLDYAQLSGDEPDSLLAALDLPAIQVIHVGHAAPDQLVERIHATPAELVLLDTAQTGSYGGTGQTFDWSLLPPLDRPFLLAGGLHPGNVSEAVQQVRPWGVDVSSGVETNGVKDAAKIEAFLAAVKGY